MNEGGLGLSFLERRGRNFDLRVLERGKT